MQFNCKIWVYAYTYDQLNRLTAMDAWGGLNNANNQFTPVSLNGAYQERITYDLNGNILSYKRNGNVTTRLIPYFLFGV